jgi:hypothetical protein
LRLPICGYLEIGGLDRDRRDRFTQVRVCGLRVSRAGERQIKENSKDE